MNIHIIVTGGTFDKEYNELNGELYFKNTHVPEMLNLGRSGLKTEIQTLMMVDSLQMTSDDRARIVECCRTAAAARTGSSIWVPHSRSFSPYRQVPTLL